MRDGGVGPNWGGSWLTSRGVHRIHCGSRSYGPALARLGVQTSETSEVSQTSFGQTGLVGGYFVGYCAMAHTHLAGTDKSTIPTPRARRSLSPGPLKEHQRTPHHELFGIGWGAHLDRQVNQPKVVLS